jgi:DNA modification methylase
LPIAILAADPANPRRISPEAATGDDLFVRLFPEIRSGGNAHRRELGQKLRSTRTFFDATHEAMTDVWQFPRVHGEERFGHATPKPVAMVERALKTSSSIGDAVGVPFGGSAPDVIACERLGRRCFAMELEPRYVDVAVARWEKFTGKKAVRADV